MKVLGMLKYIHCYCCCCCCCCCCYKLIWLMGTGNTEHLTINIYIHKCV